jgi:hypothetical protein
MPAARALVSVLPQESALPRFSGICVTSILASTPMIALDLSHEAHNKGRAGVQSAASGREAVWERRATPALALAPIRLVRRIPRRVDVASRLYLPARLRLHQCLHLALALPLPLEAPASTQIPGAITTQIAGREEAYDDDCIVWRRLYERTALDHA